MRSLSETARWIAVTFSSDGLITSLSSSTEQITGYTTRDLVGRSVTQIMADRSVFELPEIIDRARNWGFWDGEILHQDRSGRILEGHGCVSLLSGRFSENLGYSLVTILTEGQEIELSTDLGRVAARLRSISHELNNPLAVIMGFAQLILLDTQCQGKLRNDVEKLYTEVQRVIQVTEKLHNYARDLQSPTAGIQPSGL